MLLAHWLYLISGGLDLIEGAQPAPRDIREDGALPGYRHAKKLAKRTRSYRESDSAPPRSAMALNERPRLRPSPTPPSSTWSEQGGASTQLHSALRRLHPQKDDASPAREKHAGPPSLAQRCAPLPNPAPMPVPTSAPAPSALARFSASGTSAAPRALPSEGAAASSAGRLSRGQSIEGAELAAMCMSSESFKKRRPSNEEVFNRMLLRNDPTLAA